ncbi:glycosyl hydrolase [Kribbella sp. NPDC004138]
MTIDIARRGAPARRRRMIGGVLAAAGVVAALLVGAGSAGAAEEAASFDGWNQSLSGSPDLTFSAALGTGVYDGLASLRIDNATPKAPNVYGQINQSVTVQPSTVYTFSAWVKASNLSAAAGAFVPLDNAWTQRQIFPGGTYDWQKLTWQYAIPAGQTSYTFRVISQDVGTVWLDDVSMTAAGSSTNLLTNAGFETGSATTTSIGVSNSSLVFTQGNVQVALSSNLTSVDWSATTQDGQLAGQGTQSLTGGTGTLSLTSLQPGYYDLALSGTGPDGPVIRTTSLAVLRTGQARPRLADHPFAIGHHIGQTNATQLGDAVGPMGVQNLRFDLNWTNIEKTAGVYTFPAVYETQVAKLLAIGVRPLIILDYRNPLYDNNKTPSTPEGIAAFAAFAGAAAAHYGAAADYEVYNEYNLSFNDGACGRTADCYLQLLEPTSDAIHAAAPGAKVVGPVLAEIDTAWLTRFFDLGGLNYIDALSLHTYDWPSAPEGQTEAEIAALRSLMSQYPGGATKPLWWTEHGWPTPSGGNTERQQADYISRGFVLLNAAGVAKSFVYDMVATAPPTDTLANYGILRQPVSGVPAFAPKPAYVAYATLNREISGLQYSNRETVGGAVRSYIYSASGARTRVVWATTPTSVAVTSTGPFTYVDTFGAAHQADGSTTPVQLDLDGDPVYLEGTTITGISVVTSPGATLSVPTYAAAGDDVPASVNLDAASATGWAGDVTLTTDAGTSTSLSVPAGQATTGEVTLPAFTTLGTKPVTVTATRDGQLVAVLRGSTSVIDNPALTLTPVTGSDGSTTPRLQVANLAGRRPVHVDTLDWTIGGTSGTKTVGRDVAPGGALTVNLNSGRFPLWKPLAYQVTATVDGGTIRKISGTTAFAPVYRTSDREVPKIDLTSNGNWVTNGGSVSGPTDLGGNAWLSYDKQGVTLHAGITDNQQTAGDSAANLWRGDSVQMAFSPGLPGQSAARTEFGAVLLATGPALYRFSGTAGPVPGGSAQITRDEADGVTNYSVTLPWSDLGVDPNARNFSFSFLVNDADGGARKGHLEWGSGIGQTKNPAQYLPVQPMERS